MTLLKPNNDHDNELSGGFAPEYSQGCQIFADEDVSNRSSSGSAISNSESCAQYDAMDACDLTGWIKIFITDYSRIAHSSFWNKYWFYCLSRFMLAQSSSEQLSVEKWMKN